MRLFSPKKKFLNLFDAVIIIVILLTATMLAFFFLRRSKHLTVVADHPFASPAKPAAPTVFHTGRTPPKPRPFMISVDAAFLSAGRPVSPFPPERVSRHTGNEARPTSGPGGRKSGHRDQFPARGRSQR